MNKRCQSEDIGCPFRLDLLRECIANSSCSDLKIVQDDRLGCFHILYMIYIGIKIHYTQCAIKYSLSYNFKVFQSEAFKPSKS